MGSWLDAGFSLLFFIFSILLSLGSPFLPPPPPLCLSLFFCEGRRNWKAVNTENWPYTFHAYSAVLLRESLLMILCVYLSLSFDKEKQELPVERWIMDKYMKPLKHRSE